MVHITQPGALDVLAQIEGTRWRETQEACRDVPYGFFFWLRAWNAKIQAGLADMPVSLCQFAERATRGPILYGEEGYRKYHVDFNGEIALLRDTALPDAWAKALTLGLRMA